MRTAFRVKKGTQARVFGEMVQPAGDASKGDIMRCKWRDGMTREVVQMTVDKWMSMQPTPAASQSAQCESAKPENAKKNGNDAEQLDLFKGEDSDGTKIQVQLKWNRQKNQRHQLLGVVKVAGKQLVQIDAIYFESKADMVAWCNDIALTRVRNKELDKDQANTKKAKYQDDHLDLFKKRLKDLTWNNLLEQPEAADAPPAEAPAPETATAEDTGVDKEPAAVVEATPEHDTCSQDDKQGAVMGIEVSGTPPPRKRMRSKMPSDASAGATAPVDVAMATSPKRARARVEPPPFKLGDLDSDSE
jgi:hypothetical protein